MNSHLTAISRKKLPVPVRWLFENGFISGDVLDYGCGKCQELNKTIEKSIDVTSVCSYDPHYAPNGKCLKKKYDVILCTYVLCATEKKVEKEILKSIQNLLKKYGMAFISVRTDAPKGGYGYTKRGTCQRKVELPLYHIRKTSQYQIYMLTRYCELPFDTD